MSNINLVSYAIFRKEPKPAGVTLYHGASYCSIDDKGFARIIAGNVALPAGQNMTAPGSGLLMLYGFRDMQEEIRLRRHEARAKQMSFHWLEAEAEVSQIYPGIVNRHILPTIDFVNVKRLSTALQDTILRYFSVYAEERGGAFDSMRQIQQIASRPEFFERLCLEPEFRHVSILVIPVFDGVRVRQLAYVRPTARIVAVRQDATEGISLELPDWLHVKARTRERTRTA